MSTTPPARPGPRSWRSTTPPPRSTRPAGNGAQNAALNTAIGIFANAHAVLVEHVAAVRTRFGLPALTGTGGTVATAGTIPAITKAVTAGTGTACISYATYVAAVTRLQDNQAGLAFALNELEAAVALPLTPILLKRSCPPITACRRS